MIKPIEGQTVINYVNRRDPVAMVAATVQRYAEVNTPGATATPIQFLGNRGIPWISAHATSCKEYQDVLRQQGDQFQDTYGAIR